MVLPIQQYTYVIFNIILMWLKFDQPINIQRTIIYNNTWNYNTEIIIKSWTKLFHRREWM